MDKEFYTSFKKITKLVDSEDIKYTIKNLAKQINYDYKDKADNLVVIGILKGSFIFLSDLCKELNFDSFKIDFMKCSSYIGSESSGIMVNDLGLSEDIKNKDVLIVEDIVDTGLTIINLLNILSTEKPKSIKLCTLINKTEDRIFNCINPNYVGLHIKSEFVVGYGLDYNGKFRNLNNIYTVSF